MRRLASSIDFFAQAGIAGQLLDGFFAFLRSECVSLCQSLSVIAECPLFRFLARAVHVLREVGRELVVIRGDHGEGRNQENIRLVVSVGLFEGFEIQHTGEQGDAVERDAAIGKISGDSGGARGSVAFAQNEQRRGPALVARDVEADELAEGLDVSLDAPEFLEHPQNRRRG